MNEEILKLADLSNVKVGDTIWTIKEGISEVIGIGADDHYPIRTNIDSYTLYGKRVDTNKYPSAFTKNPFENVGFKERWMMVSDDKLRWRRRRVFMQKNERFYAWDSAETDEAVKEALRVVLWKYAKEIEELTLEERIEMILNNK